MSMEQGFETTSQQPFGSPETGITSSPAATEATTPPDRPQPETEQAELTHELIDKAKQLGKTTVDAGTRLYHAVEEKIHDIQERDIPLEKARKARMMASASAGTVAIAGTVGMAVRKRRHRQSAPMQTSKHLLARAKEMMPNR